MDCFIDGLNSDECSAMLLNLDELLKLLVLLMSDFAGLSPESITGEPQDPKECTEDSSE